MSDKILAGEKYMNDVCSCIFANLIKGVKRKEEMSIWGPAKLPESGKNYTKILESLLPRNDPPQKVHHDSTKNYSPEISQNINVWHKKSSELTEEKLGRGSNDGEENVKPIPRSCLRFHHVQSNENDASETQNLQTVKISDEDYQKTRIKSSSENNSPNSRPLSDEHYGNGKALENNSSNSSLFSDIEYGSGKKSVIEAQFLESMHSKLETMSIKSKSTINIQENANLEKSNKKLPHDVNKKAFVRSEFGNWCLNRNRNYKSRSNLKLSDPLTPAAMKVEVQCPNNNKHYVRKDKFYERSKSEAYLNGDNCKVDRMNMSKTNLLDKNNDQHMEKYTSDFQLTSNNLNNVMLKPKCYDAMRNQKNPKVEDKTLRCDHSFENNLPISVKVSCDKSSAVSLKVQHHDNNYHKVKVAEDVLNTNETTLKESSKFDEYVSEANHKSDLKKMFRRKGAHSTDCNQNQSYEQPPKFRDNVNDKNSINSKKQTVSKNINLKSKLPNEKDKFLKKKAIQKKDISDSHEYILNKENQYSSIKELTAFSIRIINEECDKYFEVNVDNFAISQIKRTSPKLYADIPDIDSGNKVFNYSADAMNILLRFLAYPSFKFVMPSQVATGVEVLAAAQCWNVTEFINFYQEKFLNGLTPINSISIFSHARHYDLKEICDACKSILPDNAVLRTVTSRNMCLISISTFIEPLEISIPFELTEKVYLLSFKKQIHNTFTFKAISGCYSITGLRVQLNEKHLVQKEENKIEFDYSIKGINGNRALEGSVIKPLRPNISFYFKKDLVLKPGEVGEIFIQTEIEPYLCSTHKEKKITFKNSDGELELKMESNWKVQKPEGKLFFVRKFLYHVRSS